MDGVSARAKRRWLIRWWIGQAIAVYLGFPLFVILALDGETREYGNVLADDEYATWILGAIAVVSSLQWLYLRPVREPAPAGRPVGFFWSASAGGLAVALFLAAFVTGAYGVMHDVARAVLVDEGEFASAVLGVFVLSWIAATPLLAAFAKRSASPDEALTRVATTLFAGTVVEVIAAVPFDMLARRREDCVCARGTFWTILLGFSGGLLMLGPAVFLVLLRRRRRRWPGGRCTACGADAGEDLRVPRCPACGAGWAG